MDKIYGESLALEGLPMVQKAKSVADSGMILVFIGGLSFSKILIE